MAKGVLYLIPTTLGDTLPEQVIPASVFNIVNEMDEFIVEQERTARRYLKKMGYKKSLDELILHPINKHTESTQLSGYLNAIDEGKNIGIISEAGCPGIADPGAEIVKMAHQKNIKVVPLVGPSSILLSLMASGFNGQNFAFHGYLPIDKHQKIKKIKELEKTAIAKDQTQLFIETPYRNKQLLADIVSACQASTQLCIACDITLSTEYIITKTVGEWRKKLPDIHKRPAIFLLYKGN